MQPHVKLVEMEMEKNGILPPVDPARQTRQDSSESTGSSSVRLLPAILIFRHSQARTACGTALRLGIVSANKIASCTSGNPMETGLPVDGGNPAHHTEETLCSTLKNSRDNPSDFSVQQRPAPSGEVAHMVSQLTV